MAICRRRLLDLRFDGAEEEARFQESINESIAWAIMVGGAIAMVALTIRCALLFRDAGYGQDADVVLDSFGPDSLMILFYMIVEVVTAAVTILAWVSMRGKSCRLSAEHGGCLFAAVVLWPIPLHNESHVAQLFGRQAVDVWGPGMIGCDVVQGLLITALIVILALGVRVRIHLMSPILILGWISFIASNVVFDSDLPQWSRTVHTLVSLAAVLALVLARKQELLVREAWQAQHHMRRQHKELQRRHGSTAELLHQFCDIVVRLSPDFRLLEHSNPLAALLLKQGPSSLQGASFCDFLASDDDRESFAASLQYAQYASEATGFGAANANMVGVRLRDAHGTAFTVHIHHVRINKAEGVEHLIGIVENAERAVNREQDEVGELIGVMTSLRSLQSNYTQGHGDDDASSVSGLSNHSDDSSNMGGVNSIPQDGMQADFFVNTSMQLAFCCTNFRESFDSTVRDLGFRGVLQDPDPFSQWLEEKKVAIITGNLHLPVSIEFGTAQLLTSSPDAAQEMLLTIRFPVASPTGSMDVEQWMQEGHYKVSARFDSMTSRRARKYLRRHRNAQLPTMLREAQAMGSQAQAAMADLQARHQQAAGSPRTSRVVAL